MSETTNATGYARFPNLQAAKDAGYMSPKGIHIEHGKGGVFVQDVSGASSFGYSYALRAYVSWETNGLERVENSSEVFAKTTTVFLSEAKNAIGNSGAFVELFRPDDMSRGVASAKVWIDAFNTDAWI